MHFEMVPPKEQSTRDIESVESMMEADERAEKVAGMMIKQKILTKGDNNAVDDRGLYPPGKNYVEREEVVGVVRGYVPMLGRVSIAFKESVWAKAALMVLAFVAFL